MAAGENDAGLPDTITGATGDEPSSVARAESPQLVIGLTVLWHPDVARIGERTTLLRLTPTPLSRLEPIFAAPGATAGRPLDDARLSRSPVKLVASADGVRIEPGDSPLRMRVGGERVESSVVVPAAALELGVVIELGGRVVLLLQLIEAAAAVEPDRGIVGENLAIRRLRRQIGQVADLAVPVLVRGETGSGKELVARAIVDASPRRSSPFVTVNLGAVATNVAVAELFGHERGAFTGAVGDSPGHFGNADGGTILLDEVGDASPELQVALLRVLESGEVQPVGGRQAKRVDVRVIAATELDLENAVERGTFRRALYERLAGYTIALPPLRERKDDIGRLLRHAFHAELAAIGEEQLMTRADGAPFLPAELVARLVAYDWPGNVRQLRNVVRQLCISSRGRGRIELDETALRFLDRGSAAQATPSAVDPLDLEEEAILAALQANEWHIGATAKSLGMARNSLVARIDKSSRIRRPRDVGAEEIERCRAEVGSDPARLAARLGISERGLKLRLRALGIA